MQHFLSYAKNRLAPLFPEGEVQAISRLLLKELAGWNSVQIRTGKDTKIPEDMLERLHQAIDRIAANEPVQYVLGHTEFCGLRFKVGPGVLIPRPETEELVELILKDLRNNGIAKPVIFDAGTGSGCIAIALANGLPGARVLAWDISEEALTFAGENARALKAAVEFSQADLLQWERHEQKLPELDLIVSNPPYVKEQERSEMEAHVLEKEPELALFVPDDDPLLFYRHLDELAQQKLKRGGRFYAEINSSLGPETLKLFEDSNYTSCELLQDLSGKDRVIRVIR